MGIGYFQGLTDVLNWLGPAFQVEPISAHVRQYDSYYKIYRELYPRLRDLMHRLVDLETFVGGHS
jgi:sugar (pentulose or hexulose) kinase